MKLSFFDERIVVNTATFDIARENVAALFNDPVIGETVVLDSQRTKGVEASLDAKVTDNWHILANWTAQDAVITSNPQGVASVGNHPQGVPAHIANLWTTYDFSIAGVKGFRAGGGLNYQGITYSDITNVNSAPAFVIGNAMLGYEAATWGLPSTSRTSPTSATLSLPTARGHLSAIR